MPEETNRVLTDHIADLLFTTEPDGNRNLALEGIPAEKVHFVGNPMIDSLHEHVERALTERPWERFGLPPGEYGVVTLHRPSNVDDPAVASELAAALAEVAPETPLVFPVHPRTAATSQGTFRGIEGVLLTEPLGYLEFIGLMAKAQVVLTDSGGIQEETTYLRVPCVTIRRNTERPITVTEGTNVLAPPVAREIVQAVRVARGRLGRVPDLWDGSAAVRIVDVLESWLAAQAGDAAADGAPPHRVRSR